MTLESLSRKLEEAEKRFGLHITAMMIGLLLLASASVYVTPALHTINHGVNYQKLSSAPLDFASGNPLQLRILTPLLAHVLLFRGNRYIFFPLLMGLLFMAAVYLHFRKEDSAAESLGATALMAFSTPVLFTLHFQGYTDTTSYLLLWLCLTMRNLPLQASLFSLALLNHESNAFALPFLLYRPWEENFSLRKMLVHAIPYCIAFVPFLLYHRFVISQANVVYSPDFYLNKERIIVSIRSIFRLMPIGIFEAFRLFWLIPLYAAYLTFRKKQYGSTAWLILVILCSASQLLLATDTSRLLGLAFPAILLGAKILKTELPPELFAKGLFLLLLLNFFVPVYYVGQHHMIPFFPLPVSIILKLFGIDAWQLYWK
ncbi:MAG: hypothetical protein Kow0099_15100 [Candidatus Abyssubacteria bacterium]